MCTTRVSSTKALCGAVPVARPGYIHNVHDPKHAHAFGRVALVGHNVRVAAPMDDEAHIWATLCMLLHLAQHLQGLLAVPLLLGLGHHLCGPWLVVRSQTGRKDGQKSLEHTNMDKAPVVLARGLRRKCASYGSRSRDHARMFASTSTKERTSKPKSEMPKEATGAAPAAQHQAGSIWGPPKPSDTTFGGFAGK